MSFIEQWLHDAVPALVGGEWRKGQQTFAVDNPATGETIAHVADLSADDTRDAVAAAYEAGAAWRATPVKQRSALLRRWFELINEHADDLARLMTLEQGKPLAEARGEIIANAAYLEWFAEEAKRVYGDVIPTFAEGRRVMVLKEPIGV
ncbi:MAG TPA: succinate-semialdehyde dehydrogenase (NADP(+)), partial [Halomonas sp.]|nr:succinate-semialdehyde dehydrogenase (NADP(+)) [Halomonas sp.]